MTYTVMCITIPIMYVYTVIDITEKAIRYYVHL